MKVATIPTFAATLAVFVLASSLASEARPVSHGRVGYHTHRALSHKSMPHSSAGINVSDLTPKHGNVNGVDVDRMEHRAVSQLQGEGRASAAASSGVFHRSASSGHSSAINFTHRAPQTHGYKNAGRR